MNDVLPKPFTKEGMLRVLEKFLKHMKKGALPNAAPIQHMGGYSASNGATTPMNLNVSHISTGQSLKEEASPGKSPASSWHSPSQLTGTSPNSAGGQFNTYNMTPTHPHPGFQTNAPGLGAPAQGPPRPVGHRRVVSDMNAGLEDHPDSKRQRMYPPPGPSHSNFTQ